MHADRSPIDYRRVAAVVSVLTTLSVTPLGLGQDVRPDAGMMQFPDVSASQIVFAYASDLWLVPREGGQATPLASPPGGEGFPRFSDDGATIAFMGNYEGGRDLYTIPAIGGLPTRVTHHPSGETLLGWTPDGELLFSSSGLSGLGRMSKLFTVPSDGGLPQALPVPYGGMGAISPDGEWLAYTPHSRDGRTWKRYRGGMATDIWLFNLNDHSAQRITDWEGTDSIPMWHGDMVYYLSDGGENHKLNIWRYDTGNGRREQITRYSEYDVKWPSIGPGDRGQGEIILQNGSKLYLLDLRTRQSREVTITIPGARPTIRTKRVDASSYTRSWQVSPTGKRAVVEARGDIWTLPAENGSPRNLTRTSGVAERDPAWSPDGRWIAYFSDTTGEYEMYITQSDGKGETKQLTRDSQTYYSSPGWSPDSKHILFTDKASRRLLHTIESGETKMFDQDPWGTTGRPNFSHDSRWIVYARTDEAAPIPSIWVYDVENDEKRQITTGMFGDGAPIFDRKGDYLFFRSSRTFTPTYSDVDTTFIYDNTQVIVAAPLRTDVQWPWLPESDEEEWSEDGDDEDEEGEEGEGDDDADAEGDDEDETDDEEDAEDEEPAKPDDGVSGTWEGTAASPEGDVPFTLRLTVGDDNAVTGSLESMMFSGSLTGTYDPGSKTLSLTVSIPNGPTVTFELTIDGESMSGTANADGQAANITATRTAAAGSGDDDEDDESVEAREVVEIEFEGFEERMFMLPIRRGNFGRLAVNDKNHLLYARFGDNSGLKIFDLKDDDKEEKAVSSSGNYEITADGKKVLLVRGSGSAIQKASAGGSAKNVVTTGMNAHINPRQEWAQMLTEAWRLERDFFYVANLHGVDWDGVLEQYRRMLPDCTTRADLNFIIGELIAELNVGHAYRGGGDSESQPSVSVGMLGVDFELDNGAYRIGKIYNGAPWDLDARGPLSYPGIDVNEGDYLLAVNGLPVDTSRDPWAAFVGLANRDITITVSVNPQMDEEARDVTLTPIGNEGNLRYRAWIEHNRAYVAEQTNNEVGYIYVPDTGVNGQNNLVRQFVGQFGRKALIIDERWNGGGQIPTRFIEMLNRPITNYWARRDNQDWKWPPDAHHGPKCMLINGLAGSGGDMFPWLFKYNNLGKVIGTRTWGGLVGISGNPSLIDGGTVTVPTFGFYEKDGTWGVEGHGVDPDIEVIDDPSLMVDGGDPQLDAAIALMIQEIELNPYAPPARPADPDRSGMGVTEQDK